ncbi:MAG: sn-glycerol-3-phosphate ABC transporter ATP-binding protein UgpC [Candidatus Omnitrophica bacterium]|nr:sn-glycerol-3-phosphate ABC transporter ATP-binding protein UgpC [Candidatus Omnitrophota bacterium]
MARVLLEDVSKIYPGQIIGVDRLSLEVKDKEFMVLVGPSGCGKSSTLRMIAGLEQPSSGRVTIGDRVVDRVPPRDRNIAMVFQNYALYPHMTVFENMAFGLKLRKYPGSEIRARVEEAAQILGLESLLERRPRELSGGQRQRVAVGRAIVRKPSVFLFDEPLSNLDAKLRVQMRTEIKRLHQRLQTTMIYVTHDQIEAITMGDRIAVMHQGRLQQVADPNTLYHQPSNFFVGGFIGNPPMNFLKGELVSAGDQLHFSDGESRLRIVDEMAVPLQRSGVQSVVLGVRPEDVHDKLYVSYASQENTLPAAVEMVEPMGAEAFVYLTTRGGTMVSKSLGQERPEAGQDVEVVLDMAKVHFFRADSGEVIV